MAIKTNDESKFSSAAQNPKNKETNECKEGFIEKETKVFENFKILVH